MAHLALLYGRVGKAQAPGMTGRDPKEVSSLRDKGGLGGCAGEGIQVLGTAGAKSLGQKEASSWRAHAETSVADAGAARGPGRGECGVGTQVVAIAKTWAQVLCGREIGGPEQRGDVISNTFRAISVLLCRDRPGQGHWEVRETGSPASRPLQ